MPSTASNTVPSAAPRLALVAVAAAEPVLRAGCACRIVHDGRDIVVVAAETVDDAMLAGLAGAGKGVELVLSAQRMKALGERAGDDGAVRLKPGPCADLRRVHALVDPTREGEGGDAGAWTAGDRLDEAALELCKIAGLLPAALVVAKDGPAAVACEVDADAVLEFRTAIARDLKLVSQARVPLAEAPVCTIAGFRSSLGGAQHYAILIGRPDAGDDVLCRLHSECFTGDLFASLRCDCGEQLHGAIRRMSAEGGGVLLYLAQEGRGIGLMNKLRAYTLQDTGIDTVDANMHLGFDPDERDFLAAATMLDALGFRRVRLMTNNPAKIEGLARYGIEVVERVTHSFMANDHNRDYLETKARRSGHLLSFGEGRAAPDGSRGAA